MQYNSLMPINAERFARQLTLVNIPSLSALPSGRVSVSQKHTTKCLNLDNWHQNYMYIHNCTHIEYSSAVLGSDRVITFTNSTWMYSYIPPVCLYVCHALRSPPVHIPVPFTLKQISKHWDMFGWMYFIAPWGEFGYVYFNCCTAAWINKWDGFSPFCLGSIYGGRGTYNEKDRYLLCVHCHYTLCEHHCEKFACVYSSFKLP